MKSQKMSFIKNIAQEIIDFTKERFIKDNLIYSASDADSLLDFKSDEKEEGVYFVFVYDDVMDFLFEKGYEKKEIKKIVKIF